MGRALGVLVRRRRHPDTYDTLAREGRLAEMPTNHSPQFAPVLDPTVCTGVQTLVTAAGSWLASG